MPLHLTSCVPVRGPGFSASECLGLASAIDRGDLLHTGTFECDACGSDVMPPDGISRRQAATIVAALRAYAR